MQPLGGALSGAATSGIIAKILKTSAVDGPGNRAVVFFQGCNFNCSYCHNPETINYCDHCGLCVPACQYGALGMDEGLVLWNPAHCADCGACLLACPKSSSPKSRRMSAEEILNELSPYKAFLSGLSISGGEACVQMGFLAELVKKAASHGLPCLVDSNGSADFSAYPELVAAADGFMLDIKAWNKAEHFALAEASNRVVIKNLHYLAAAGKLYEARTVISPGLFNIEETVTQSSRAILAGAKASGKMARYKLLRYRPNGVRPAFKNKLLLPDPELMERLAALARAEGLKEVIIT